MKRINENNKRHFPCKTRNIISRDIWEIGEKERRKRRRKKKRERERRTFCDRTVWKNSLIEQKEAVCAGTRGRDNNFSTCGPISKTCLIRFVRHLLASSRRIVEPRSGNGAKCDDRSRSNRVFHFPERWKKCRGCRSWRFEKRGRRRKKKKRKEKKRHGTVKLKRGERDKEKKRKEKWRKARRARVPCRWPRIARSNSSNSRNNSNKRNRINNRRI